MANRLPVSTLTQSLAGGLSATCRGRVAQIGFIVIIGILFGSCPNEGRGQQADWTVPRVLQILKAREDRVLTLACTVEISQVIPADHERFYKARAVSAKALGEAQGKRVTAPDRPYEKPDARPPYRLRYWRDDQGHEHIDHLEVEDQPPWKVVSSYIKKDSRWYILNDNQITIEDSKNIPRVALYLGFDFDWENATDALFTRTRSLFQVIKDAHDRGLVGISVPGKEPSAPPLVKIIIHAPGNSGHPQERDLVMQYVFWLDKTKGMAPVKYEIRSGKKKAQSFEESWAPTWSEGYWDRFKEVKDGLWLPSTFKSFDHRSVFFPKSGSSYPPGFVFRTASPSVFRVESFEVGRTDASVSEVQVNQLVDANVFNISHGPDVIVYDTFTEKAYQKKTVSSSTLDELEKATQQRTEDAPRPAMVRMLLGLFSVVIIGLICVAGLLYFWKRAPRGR